MFPQFTAYTYGLFHAFALLAFFIYLIQFLPAAIRVSTSDIRQIERRTARHAGLLTLVYLLSNFVVAKFLFDLRQNPADLDCATTSGWSIIEPVFGAGLPFSFLWPWPIRLSFGCLAC